MPFPGPHPTPNLTARVFQPVVFAPDSRAGPGAQASQGSDGMHVGALSRAGSVSVLSHLFSFWVGLTRTVVTVQPAAPLRGREPPESSTLLLTCCVTEGKSLTLSGRQYPPTLVGKRGETPVQGQLATWSLPTGHFWAWRGIGPWQGPALGHRGAQGCGGGTLQLARSQPGRTGLLTVLSHAPGLLTVRFCFPGPRAQLGCLVSHEPLWSQGAGDVDTPEAVTVTLGSSEGARPLSILITQARNPAAERPLEMEALIGPEGRGRFLRPRARSR